MNYDLPSTGTVLNASEDVLDVLHDAGNTSVPARTQQDLVALVKTVYALTHTSRLTMIRQLAEEVAHDLSTSAIGTSSLAGSSCRGKVASSEAAVVDKVRSFWMSEFNSETPAGRKWRALVQLAHVETPDVASRAWGMPMRQSVIPYESAMEELENELKCLVCPC